MEIKKILLNYEERVKALLLLYLLSFSFKNYFIVPIFGFTLDFQDHASLFVIFFSLLTFYEFRERLNIMNIGYGFIPIFFLLTILISSLNPKFFSLGTSIQLLAMISLLVLVYNSNEIFKDLKFYFILICLINSVYFIFQKFLMFTINDVKIFSYGFDNERLFFICYISLGYLLINEKLKNEYLKIILIIILVAFGLSTGSFTGLVLIFLAIIISNYEKYKYIIIGTVIFFSLCVLVVPSKTIGKIPKLIKILNIISSKDAENFTQSFWRFRASETLIENFIKNPKIFGNGYRSNVTFLQDELTQYGKEVGRIIRTNHFVSPHTFVSIFHDQGIFGIVFFILLILHPITKFNKTKFNLFNDNFLNYYYLMILIQFMFYYQEKPNIFIFAFFIIFFHKQFNKIKYI